MQVVNAACVLDPQPGLQERLDRGDGCFSDPEQWQGCGQARILEAPNTRKPRILQPPGPSLGTPLLSGTQRPQDSPALSPWPGVLTVRYTKPRVETMPQMKPTMREP